MKPLGQHNCIYIDQNCSQNEVTVLHRRGGEKSTSGEIRMSEPHCFKLKWY